MSLIEIVSLSLALSADAFAASIGAGIKLERKNILKRTFIAFSFAFFQFLMPLLGNLLGNTFAYKIKALGAPCAFLILFIIGINMLIDDENEKGEKSNQKSFFLNTFILSIATSIDALSVGTVFSFLNTGAFKPSLIIGIITFIVCITGANLGQFINDKYKNSAQRAGGAVLLILSFKILVNYLK